MAKCVEEARNLSKLQNAKKQFKVKCIQCDHILHFYPFENKDRKICKWCGNYIYKDEKAKEKYKKEAFERKLKKYMEESAKSDKTNKRRKGNIKKSRINN